MTRKQERHPQGRNCQDLALLIIVFFPVAVPALAARSWWLRRRSRPEGTLRDGDGGGSCPLMLLSLLALPTGLTVIVWHALSAWI